MILGCLGVMPERVSMKVVWDVTRSVELRFDGRSRSALFGTSAGGCGRRVVPSAADCCVRDMAKMGITMLLLF